MKFAKLNGLIAATYSPLRSDGALNLKPIERMAEHLAGNGVAGVFVAGTTGEGHSLTLEERRRLASWWAEVLRNSQLKLIVHVGHNCLNEARELAEHAQKIGADAIAALSPSYFKPSNAERLVACCQTVAAAAPNLPFYYYDIPAWTGVHLPMEEFLALGKKRIPNLAGIKYSNSNLAQFQQCVCAQEGEFDIVYGSDETLLAGLTLGARAAIGSTYNFAAPIYNRLIQAFIKGDLETARMEQARSVEVVQTISHFGYAAASKVVMSLVGIDCGPPRLPLAPLTPTQQTALRQELDRIEFFEWIGPHHMHARKPTVKKPAGGSRK